MVILSSVISFSKYSGHTSACPIVLLLQQILAYTHESVWITELNLNPLTGAGQQNLVRGTRRQWIINLLINDVQSFNFSYKWRQLHYEDYHAPHNSRCSSTNPIILCMSCNCSVWVNVYMYNIQLYDADWGGWGHYKKVGGYIYHPPCATTPTWQWASARLIRLVDQCLLPCTCVD